VRLINQLRDILRFFFSFKVTKIFLKSMKFFQSCSVCSKD